MSIKKKGKASASVQRKPAAKRGNPMADIAKHLGTIAALLQDQAKREAAEEERSQARYEREKELYEVMDGFRPAIEKALSGIVTREDMGEGENLAPVLQMVPTPAREDVDQAYDGPSPREIARASLEHGEPVVLFPWSDPVDPRSQRANEPIAGA